MPKGPFQLKLVSGREYEFGQDSSFQVEGNGILKVLDATSQRQITFGPGSWLSVESALPNRPQQG